MHKSLDHAITQAEIWARHRYKRSKTAINTDELAELRAIYYREPLISFWEDEIGTIKAAYHAAALSNQQEHYTNDCQCGDDQVEQLCLQDDGEDYKCGTCANSYQEGFADALRLAHQIYTEMGVPALRPDFQSLPAWSAPIYTLYPQE